MAKTEEYNSKPVPLNKRMGFAGPAWVWSGFGIAFICSDKAKTLLTVCGEFNMLMTILMLALAVNCGSFMGIILHSYSSNN